ARRVVLDGRDDLRQPRRGLRGGARLQPDLTRVPAGARSPRRRRRRLRRATPPHARDLRRRPAPHVAVPAPPRPRHAVPRAPATRFALLFSYLTGITALGKYWFKLELVPQPERYHLEMDMAFWIAAALLLYPRLNRGRVRNFVLCAGAVAVIALAISQHRSAR